MTDQINWTPEELAKIERFRAERAAGRVLGHPQDNTRRRHYYAVHRDEEGAMQRLTDDIMAELARSGR